MTAASFRRASAGNREALELLIEAIQQKVYGLALRMLWHPEDARDATQETLLRAVKKRVWLAKGYGSFQSAWRTLQGIETVAMIRKGRVRWLAKGDAVGQAHFIAELFGLAA